MLAGIQHTVHGTCGKRREASAAALPSAAILISTAGIRRASAPQRGPLPSIRERPLLHAAIRHLCYADEQRGCMHEACKRTSHVRPRCSLQMYAGDCSATCNCLQVVVQCSSHYQLSQSPPGHCVIIGIPFGTEALEHVDTHHVTRRPGWVRPVARVAVVKAESRLIVLHMDVPWLVAIRCSA